MNKIIFCDVDGVLNHSSWYVSEEYSKLSQDDELDLDPNCIRRLNIMSEETNSKIVISSDWKIVEGWKSRLEKAGLQNIIDCTPVTLFGTYGSTYHFSRGEEIQMWLEWHPQFKKYIILDDRTDFMEEQLPHFIHIDSFCGLTDYDLALAIQMLNR